MATNAKALTKGWIEYLKGTQIVQLKSDPAGNLIYKKPVTADILDRFLRNTAEFDEDAISKAIHTVLAKKATGKQPPKLQNTPQKQDPPAQQKQLDAPQVKQLGNNVPATPKKKYNNDSATDIDFKDINEAIKDIAYEVDEDDVEAVFNILTAPASTAAPAAKPEVDQEAELAKRTEELNHIKRIIRNTMTDAQRKMLWRILTDA